MRWRPSLMCGVCVWGGRRLPCLRYGDTTIKMPREVLKALYGAKLTFEEFLTIDGTALADVLKVGCSCWPHQLDLIQLSTLSKLTSARWCGCGCGCGCRVGGERRGP